MAKKTKHYYATGPIAARSRVAGHLVRHNYDGYPMSYRPYGGHSLLRNPVLAIKENLVHPLRLDNLYAMISLGAGAIGTYAIPTAKLVAKIPGVEQYKIVQVLVGNVINMTVLATGAKMVFKNKPEVAKNVMAGALTLTGLQMLGLLAKKLPDVAVVQKLSPATAMSGLGDDLDVLRAKIEEQVKQELMQGLGQRSLPYETVGERSLPYETVGERSLPYETVGQVELNKMDADGITADTM